MSNTKKKRALARDVRIPAGRVIKALLAERDVNQAEASLRMGKTRGWMNLVIKGHYYIKLQDIFDIAATFDMKPSDIVRRIEELKV
jgi:hypothetical protein